jgi:hypothetical protein
MAEKWCASFGVCRDEKSQRVCMLMVILYQKGEKSMLAVWEKCLELARREWFWYPSGRGRYAECSPIVLGTGKVHRHGLT